MMTLRIISLVGTYGAGKTTVGLALAESLSRAGFERRQVAYVVNEAGGVTIFSTPYAQVETLPNGCFTCQDDADLLAALARYEKAGVAVVILEGFGLVSGDEVEAFLSRTPYSYQLVAVLDAENLATNLLGYGESMIASHLLCACGVVVTKVSAVGGDSQSNMLKVLCDRYANTVPRYETLRGKPEWPHDLLARVLAPRVRFSSLVSHLCGPECTHHHASETHHVAESTLVHGWRTIMVPLRATVTIRCIKRLFTPLVERGVVRVKGVVEGQSFNVAPFATNWQLASSSDSSYLIVYTDESKCQLTTVPGLADICESVPVVPMSYQLLRIDTSRDETVVEIKRLQEQLDILPVQVSPQGALVTHPEVPLQLLKEMARRPAVKSTWFVPVITSCLRYWVRAARYWRENTQHFTASHFAVHGRELGVSLAWWVTEYEHELDPALVAAVRALKPAVMVAEGLVSLATLRSDTFWRYWQVQEYERALNFGGVLSSDDLATIRRAREHLLFLQADEVLAL